MTIQFCAMTFQIYNFFISIVSLKAVIELENPFEMDRHISTVCLPPSGFVPNQQDCFASGWGKSIFNLVEFQWAFINLSIIKFQYRQGCFWTSWKVQVSKSHL